MKWPKHVRGRPAIKEHQNTIVCLLELILYSGGFLLDVCDIQRCLTLE